jgi:DNA-binding transcriptional LysR family regulator
MDKLQAMRIFVGVVEAGTFSAVAYESDTTQRTVSKHVGAPEREPGAGLLTCTTRSLALTEHGVRYFEQVRRLVTEIAEAEGTLQRGEQELIGWLIIRRSTVEHVFGTLKPWMGPAQFLTKTLERVSTEMSLQVLAYTSSRS